MNRSTNYNFYLPENSDYRDVSAFNYNFTTIDTELNTQNNRSAVSLILDTGYTLTTSGSLPYSCSWSGHTAMFIGYGNYGNLGDTAIVPTSEFNETSDGHAVILEYANNTIQVYKNGTTGVYIATTAGLNNGRVRIWALG